MRIVHVTPSFAPAWAYGGIPRCSYELCRALVQLGEDVTVWTTDALDEQWRTAERQTVVDGVQVCRFANLSNQLAYRAQCYLPRGFLTYAWRWLPEFDLVHVHSHRHLLQSVVGLAARIRGCPVVFTGHGTVPAIERYIWLKRFLDFAGGAVPLRRAAACIAVSQAEVEHYRRAGVAEDRITVITNGIRRDEYEPLPAAGSFRRRYGLGDDPLVVFVGKITPRKGLDVLLRAVGRMPNEVRLAVVGNFMMNEEPVRRLVGALGLNDRVLFTGLLLGEGKLAAYVDADVVAYPCVDEIFGLVPAEALMCGSPVVVCEDSGCGEIVRASGGGRLVPYGDPDALATALQELLEDPGRRLELATRGRQYVATHLDWGAVGEQTCALYRKVVGAAGEPASSDSMHG